MIQNTCCLLLRHSLSLSLPTPILFLLYFSSIIFIYVSPHIPPLSTVPLYLAHSHSILSQANSTKWSPKRRESKIAHFSHIIIAFKNRIKSRIIPTTLYIAMPLSWSITQINGIHIPTGSTRFGAQEKTHEIYLFWHIPCEADYIYLVYKIQRRREKKNQTFHWTHLDTLQCNVSIRMSDDILSSMLAVACIYEFQRKHLRCHSWTHFGQVVSRWAQKSKQ